MPIPSLQHLNHPKLIKKKYQGKIAELMNEKDDPVAFAIVNKIVKRKNFYPNLATVLNLPYYQEIPQTISSSQQSIHQIPEKILIKHTIYCLIQNNKLIIITSNPFLTQSIVKDLIQFTNTKSYQLAISNPVEIRNALSHAFYLCNVTITQYQVHTQQPHLSSKTSTHKNHILLTYKIFLITTILSLIFFPYKTLLTIYIITNCIYFAINPLKIYVFLKGLKQLRRNHFNLQTIQAITYQELPIYTLLVPLRNEPKIVKKIVKNLLNLEYPKDKLDIKIIVDVDDIPTITALKKIGVGLSSNDASKKSQILDLVIVPESDIATKPRVCNYALAYSKGTYCVIYDAEDRPQRYQLLQAYLGFMDSTLDTVCLQAKLNYYNSRQNILTRLFSLEYGFWFDYYLQGLQAIDAPIPLGGTSNHFITDSLKRLGTWDPYNVTEDADLGMRIYRHNYKTDTIDSYTYEEANSQLTNWIRQRTRWQKGFLQTFIVHSRDISKLYNDLGFRRFYHSIIIFGGNFFLPLFNPFLWFIFLASLFSSWTLGSVGWEISLIALFNLIIGNLTYLIIHLLAALKSGKKRLIPFTILLPFYWGIISLATIRASYQYLVKPYYWEKTTHGIAKRNKTLSKWKR